MFARQATSPTGSTAFKVLLPAQGQMVTTRLRSCWGVGAQSCYSLNEVTDSNLSLVKEDPGQVEWHTLAILALGSLRQNELEFRQSYKGRPLFTPHPQNTDLVEVSFVLRIVTRGHGPKKSPSLCTAQGTL